MPFLLTATIFISLYVCLLRHTYVFYVTYSYLLVYRAVFLLLTRFILFSLCFYNRYGRYRYVMFPFFLNVFLLFQCQVLVDCVIIYVISFHFFLFYFTYFAIFSCIATLRTRLLFLARKFSLFCSFLGYLK